MIIRMMIIRPGYRSVLDQFLSCLIIIIIERERERNWAKERRLYSRLKRKLERSRAMQKARGRENLIIIIIPKVRTGRFMTKCWYLSSMWWPWNQFLTKCFPNQQFSLKFVYKNSSNLYLIFYLLKVDQIMIDLRPMSHL